jgi:hypothetical protein
MEDSGSWSAVGGDKVVSLDEDMFGSLEDGIFVLLEDAELRALGDVRIGSIRLGCFVVNFTTRLAADVRFLVVAFLGAMVDSTALSQPLNFM